MNSWGRGCEFSDFEVSSSKQQVQSIAHLRHQAFPGLRRATELEGYRVRQSVSQRVRELEGWGIRELEHWRVRKLNCEVADD